MQELGLSGVGLAHEAPLLLEARRSQFGNYRDQTGKLAKPMLGRSNKLVKLNQRGKRGFRHAPCTAQAADARLPDTPRRSRERKRRWSAHEDEIRSPSWL